jgi:hypothetical protein
MALDRSGAFPSTYKTRVTLTAVLALLTACSGRPSPSPTAASATLKDAFAGAFRVGGRPQPRRIQ